MAKITIGRTGNGTGGMNHSARVEFIDNSNEVLRRYNAGASAATQAAGIKAVGVIVNQMQKGYGAPIRQTGDLMRDVAYEAVDEKTIRVGNRLEYAVFVHEGTSRMRGRAYIKDALLNRDNMEKIKKVYKKYIKESVENG